MCESETAFDSYNKLLPTTIFLFQQTFQDLHISEDSQIVQQPSPSSLRVTISSHFQDIRDSLIFCESSPRGCDSSQIEWLSKLSKDAKFAAKLAARTIFTKEYKFQPLAELAK